MPDTLDTLRAALDALVPPGTVMAFAGEVEDRVGTDGQPAVVVVRPGWLLCNGAAVSDRTYEPLWRAIQASHGNGSDKPSPLPGASFNLPDFRGLFLRGTSGLERSRDPDRDRRDENHLSGNRGNRVGSVQQDQVRANAHGLPLFLVIDRPGGSQNIKKGDDDKYGAGNLNDVPQKSTNSAGGEETRPKNAYVNWIIKT